MELHLIRSCFLTNNSRFAWFFAPQQITITVAAVAAAAAAATATYGGNKIGWYQPTNSGNVARNHRQKIIMIMSSKYTLCEYANTTVCGMQCALLLIERHGWKSRKKIEWKKNWEENAENIFFTFPATLLALFSLKLEYLFSQHVVFQLCVLFKYFWCKCQSSVCASNETNNRCTKQASKSARS